MGIRIPYIKYIEKYFLENVGDFNGKSMLELGDQVMRGRVKPQEKTGKEYFENKGMEHISIDMNGKHGALSHDLSKPIINPNWVNHFDIITNLGTTEHVEPQSGQYDCFRNIHNFLKVSGIVVHILPDIETRKANGVIRKHANNYYKESFFSMLEGGEACKLIDLTRKGYNYWACLKKISDTPFMDYRDEFTSHLIREEGGKIWKGING